MKKENKIKATGRLRIKVYENGRLIEDSISNNLIVNGGLDNVRSLLAGDTANGFAITTYKAGTSNTTPVLTDTAITAPFTKAIAGYSYPAGGKVNFNFTMELVENNGMTIAEYGLFNSNGVLCARITRTPLLKTSSIRLVGDWEITYSN